MLFSWPFTWNNRYQFPRTHILFLYISNLFGKLYFCTKYIHTYIHTYIYIYISFFVPLFLFVQNDDFSSTFLIPIMLAESELCVCVCAHARVLCVSAMKIGWKNGEWDGCCHQWATPNIRFQTAENERWNVNTRWISKDSVLKIDRFQSRALFHSELCRYWRLLWPDTQ